MGAAGAHQGARGRRRSRARGRDRQLAEAHVYGRRGRQSTGDGTQTRSAACVRAWRRSWRARPRIGSTSRPGAAASSTSSSSCSILQLVQGRGCPSLRVRGNGGCAGGAAAAKAFCPTKKRRVAGESYAFCGAWRIACASCMTARFRDHRRRRELDQAGAPPRLPRCRRRGRGCSPTTARIPSASVQAMPATCRRNARCKSLDRYNREELMICDSGYWRVRWSRRVVRRAASPIARWRVCPSTIARRSSPPSKSIEIAESNLASARWRVTRPSSSAASPERAAGGQVEARRRPRRRRSRQERARRSHAARRLAQRGHRAQPAHRRPRQDGLCRSADRAARGQDRRGRGQRRRRQGRRRADQGQPGAAQRPERTSSIAAASRWRARTRRSGSPSSAPASPPSTATSRQLRTAWDDRRREFNTASRGDVRDLHAPPPPSEVKMPAFKNDPRGDVNDTPGAPANRQSQDPQNNIAPAP